jgi:hypothetical protein
LLNVLDAVLSAQLSQGMISKLLKRRLSLMPVSYVWLRDFARRADHCVLHIVNRWLIATLSHKINGLVVLSNSF